MNLRLAKTYRKRRFIVILVLAAILLFFALQKGLLKKLSPTFVHIATPVWTLENMGRDFLALTFESKKDLYKQNVALKGQILKYEDQVSIYNAVVEENDYLKALLGRIKPEMKVVLSLILAKPNQTPYDTLIIDRGTNDGISVDDLVFAHGDVLIGFIESVDKSSAKVLMYSTPGNISQVVYGNSGKYFNARGAGNGTLEVEVSREIEVAVGDQFFYPGLDNTLVGVVEKVHFDPRDSFKKVIIKSPVNIQEERWVEVRI
jgi:cell shape-determining protein MreC